MAAGRVVSLLLRRLGRASAVLVALLSVSCNSLFYHPYRGVYRTPVRPFQTLRVPTRDGLALDAWLLPARGEARGTVVQFHGNGGNLTSHFQVLEWVTEHGLSLLVFDYRGYGRSPGTPSPAGLEIDAQSAIRFAQGLPRGRWGNDLVLVGQSLGGAVLLSAYAKLAARERVRAVVVEGTFHAYTEIAASVLWRIPLLMPFSGLSYSVVSDEYSPAGVLARVAPTPLLVIHGAADGLVPPAFGRAVFALGAQPKTLWMLPEVGHLRAFERRDTQQRLIAYLRDL